MRKIVLLAAAAGLLAAPAFAQDGTLKKIKETGVFNVSYRESSIPFSYLDDNQKPIGFAKDICDKVVDAVKAELKLPNLEVKYTPVTSATRIPLLANGTIDIECGSTTNNADRQQQVSFTNTHYLTASAFVSKKSANLAKIDDLKGKTIVSTAGTTNIEQVNKVNTERNLGMNILAAKDHAEAFLMVQTGRAVAFVMDDILLASLIASSKAPADYVISPDTFSLPEPYGIMVRKDDPEFKALVDKTTAALYKSPEGEALYTKWFMTPVPPKNLNFNVPMSPAQKKAFANPSDSPDPKSYQ